MTEAAHDEFYLRWREGHETDQMEFILTPSGRLKYANNSHYRNDYVIHKEVCVSPAVVDEFKRIVLESGIQSVDDCNWDRVDTRDQDHRGVDMSTGSSISGGGRSSGMTMAMTIGENNNRNTRGRRGGMGGRKNHVRIQELEIKVGNEHLAFTCEEIGSLSQVLKSKDPEGLKVFYYLSQDLKSFVYSLISLHFKIKPIPK